MSLCAQAEKAKAVSQSAASTLAAAPLKDGVHVTLSASYKEHDDAKDGPLQPGQYGTVVQGGGTSRVQVIIVGRGLGAEGGHPGSSGRWSRAEVPRLMRGNRQ